MAGSAVSRRVSEFAGVALFAVALIWFMALGHLQRRRPGLVLQHGIRHRTRQLRRPHRRVRRPSSRTSCSATRAYLVPLVLAVIGWHYFWCHVVDAAYTKLIGAALLFSCVSSFLSLAFGTLDISGKSFRAGGYVGDALASLLAAYLNRTGSIILILTLLFLSIILSTQFSLRTALLLCRRVDTRSLGGAAGSHSRPPRGDSARQAAPGGHQEAPRQGCRRTVKDAQPGKEPVDAREAFPTPYCGRCHAAAAAQAAARPSRRLARFQDACRGGRSEAVPSRRDGRRGCGRAEGRVSEADASAGDQASTSDAFDTVAAALSEPEKLPAERKRGAFIPPPLALLDAPKGERKIDERELMEGARLLEEKCREFSVEGSVVQIHPGPGRDDLRVQAGRRREVQQDHRSGRRPLSGDAGRVRPDRSHPGQIHGRHPDSRTRTASRSPCASCSSPMPTGVQRPSSRSRSARPSTASPSSAISATMPHLLIAGSTGTGKSVSVNAMLSSILFRASPDEVRLIMIDPKRLELGMYEDIPHLLTPVVVDPKLASNALRWAVREMEERYKTLAAVGVRNIEQYNRNLRLAQEENKGPVLDDNGNEVKPLPFIVVLIDELADLMMVAGNEVEESIARLAQMARAVGIHLILATQRPSVDVITGLIKANLPARISFRVSSKTDSRTILDGNGAEQLLGKGDMLYLPPASSRFVRLHGPYISEQESARLASFLRKQGKPTYDDDDHGRTTSRRRAISSSRRTISTTRRLESWSRAARPRFRICSGGCGSASAARRGLWT